MKVLDDFLNITNYNISVYFNDINTFIKDKFPSVIKYYEGEKISSSIFSELDRLTVEAGKIEQIFSSFNLSSSTIFWDLLDDFEETKARLETINNFGKWSRSSYVFGYDRKVKSEYILSQNQDMEQVSSIIGDSNPNDNWVDISIDNQLKEIDYTHVGGNSLFINESYLNRGIINNGVVDYMVGGNILGKDLTKKLGFENDDLSKLDYIDTFTQSAEICISVSKKSVPEFPNIGFNKTIVGSSLSFILSNSIERDITNNFKTDDSFKSIELLDISSDSDVAKYEFKITSRLDNEINKIV